MMNYDNAVSDFIQKLNDAFDTSSMDKQKREWLRSYISNRRQHIRNTFLAVFAEYEKNGQMQALMI